MAGDGQDGVSAGGASAMNAVKGFRFRTSGKTVDWCEGMDSISPFLAAMARKVQDPEGSSVEMDGSCHVLVDDSSYSPKVIDVLVAALERKKRRLNLDELEVEDLLEFLKCADFYQLAHGSIHQVCMALWTKMSSYPAEGSAVLEFKQIQFKQPLVLESLSLQRLEVRELVLQNVSIKKEVSFADVVFTDSSLSLGIGGDFSATRTAFQKSKLTLVCRRAVLESCTFQDSKWDGPADLPEDLTVKEGVLSSTQLPPARRMVLESVSMTDCEFQQVDKLTIQGKCSFVRTQIPKCSRFVLYLTNVDLSSLSLQCEMLEVTDGSLSQMSVHCEPPDWIYGAVLTRVEGECLDLRAPMILLSGLTLFRDCRLRQDYSPPWETLAEPIMATGSVISGMTFLIGNEPVSCKDCTFHRCTFELDGSGGHCVALDNCTLVACSTRSRRRDSDTYPPLVTNSEWVRSQLSKHFHTPCQVVAALSELPEGLPSRHLEWMNAAETRGI